MWTLFASKFRDWRTWLVVGAVLVAYAASFALGHWYKEVLFVNRDAVFVSFYGSWVQDVLFFSLVGIAVVAYTAPFRADDATFDQRIMAFYGSLSPKPLRDYAKGELRRYGGYAPHAERAWTLLEYDAGHEAFKVDVYVKYVIKNIFDVEYVDNPLIKIKPDIFENPPTPIGEMEWITIGDVGQLPDGIEEIDPKKGWSKNITLKIASRGEITYESKYWLWTKTGEECGFTPSRVVENFDMVIRNSTKNVVVNIGFPKTEGDNLTLPPGGVQRLPRVENVTPNDRFFVVRLDPPAKEG